MALGVLRVEHAGALEMLERLAEAPRPQIDSARVAVRLEVFGLRSQGRCKALCRGGSLAGLVRLHPGCEGGLPGSQAHARREEIFQYPSQHAALSLTKKGGLVARADESGENQALQEVVS